MEKALREQFTGEFLLSLLEKMLLIRRFEEKASQAYGLRKIGGFLHLYIGQEATGVGAVAAIDQSVDYVLTAYRDHGIALALGMKPGVLMAELYGKETGCSRGKGGSMHFFDVKKNFLGGNGIVGAHIPLATGVGLKIRNKNERGVVLCFFGDGAIHQGSFHESLNMAQIWGLPVLYICENNQYGMGTDFRRVSAVTDFTILGQSYDIKGKQVNGMDVLEVYQAVKEQVEQIREVKRPGFLEIKTYRYKGHSMSDPAKYRTREELEAYRQQDPVLLLKVKLLNGGVLTEEKFLQMDSVARRKSEEAALYAERSPDPSLESLYEDVYKT
ncbi:MAG: pyruvate dehydrogenase (acetyl-transferring) E1 component subunit alpha [Fibrobacter sp.]|nr:pyruvate dehydrogenase (acetyl-transferring) E1 component subunit alpha [Fibrobacter sp.]